MVAEQTQLKLPPETANRKIWLISNLNYNSHQNLQIEKMVAEQLQQLPSEPANRKIWLLINLNSHQYLPVNRKIWLPINLSNSHQNLQIEKYGC